MTTTLYVVQDGPADSQGRVPYTAYWREPEGVFRPEPNVKGTAPVGYNRAQCYRTDRPITEVFPNGVFALSNGHPTLTHDHAERFAHTPLTPGEILRATNSLGYILCHTGISGSARGHVEVALAWLAKQDR